MMKTPKIHIAALLMLAAFFVSCSDKDDEQPSQAATGNVQFKIEHTVNGEPLNISDKKYKNALNQEYIIDELKYFLSNVKLRNRETGDIFFEDDSYHLVLTDRGQNTFSFTTKNVPLKEYTEIEFAIGVDNAHNTSIDKIGDLNPNSGMNWDWTTGYKFINFNGVHYASNTAGDPLVFHIGEDHNYSPMLFKTQQLNLPSVRVTQGKDVVVTIRCEISEMFKNPSDIDFTKISKVTGGPNAIKIAENYETDVWTIVDIQ